MHNRRSFLRNTSALALGSLLLNKEVLAEVLAKKFPGAGLQLFTLFGV
ncbi:MAG: Sugar phosphate isomerase/epimerase, partial [Sediminibacterium sp.]|nr:Sugar phosphate isomerase/epimerase [Sediminibacterium sp.]